MTSTLAPRAAPGRGDASERRLVGTVERVTFHSRETGFCVLKVEAAGHPHPVAVVGRALAVQAGEFVEVEGAWVTDRVHGVQFRADRIETAAPSTVEGLEKYLGSGLIFGVGPVCARKLVDAFGEEVLGVIADAPERLREIQGVGPWRARQIVEAWAEQRSLREITLFLHGHGVDASRSVRIYKTYGPRAGEVVSEDPYRLARDVRGFAFAEADRLAARFGIDGAAPERLRAGLVQALTDALREGHCGLPVEEMVLRAGRLLDVPLSACEASVAVAAVDGDLEIAAVRGRRCAFLAGLAASERAVARRVRALAKDPPPWGRIDLGAYVARAEAGMGVALATGQVEALRTALTSKVLVVTGGPGTGKTALVNGLLHALAERNLAVALCAPTGRAAKRLSESTGLEARTIHRLLEVDAFNGGFARGPTAPVDADLLVVDEMSMVDVPLMHALLRAVPDRTALVLVGDVDQLPSIGPGQVLADLIRSEAVPVVRLTQVFRQEEGSRIVETAHAINRGVLPDLRPLEGSDLYLVEAEENEAGLDKLVTLVRERIPKRFGLDPIRDVQVLAPMNRGGFGVRSLNLTLQAALNGGASESVERFGSTFRLGDKVMQVQNAYERDVYNGDLGRVSAIDPGEGRLTVTFDGRDVAYAFGELDELVLAYATTIHKAQGSEYPAVVIPLTLAHAPLLRRNLLYTGVTRGRRLVVLYGSREALDLAVKDDHGMRRWTQLAQHLAASQAKAGA